VIGADALSGDVAIRIEVPTGTDALTEFVLFHDEVYRPRQARWPAGLGFQLPVLTGASPFAADRRLRPLVAREDGRIVARALAVVDERSWRHWNDRLAHLSLFEALPGARMATRALVDAACTWLGAQGASAVRTGSGPLDFPYAVDEHERLPPIWLRQNPSYYHVLLKDAGFVTEQGWVDYALRVTPELTARWESALEAARRGGFAIVPLAEVAPERRARDFTAVWNDAFAHHFGHIPFTEAEIVSVMELFAAVGMLDASVLAYRDDEPVGALWYLPDSSAFARLAPGRTLAADERLNCLGIGVRASARGRGVNLAMAAFAYLVSVRAGATDLSYTLVLDDNWASRRTAEKLGATVCANYVTYRRTLHRLG
jgi:hypothetical protein